MSPLRRRMIEDMTVRNLSPYTQRNYLFAVSRLARHVRMSPADVGPEQLRDYLNHLVGRNLSPSYFNVNVAALRFLYMVVLERGHRQVERRPAWRSRGGSDICPG